MRCVVPYVYVHALYRASTRFQRMTRASYRNNDNWTVRSSVVVNATLPPPRVISNTLFARVPHVGACYE